LDTFLLYSLERFQFFLRGFWLDNTGVLVSLSRKFSSGGIVSILLIGYRQDLLLIKYRLLFQNWNLNFRLCYSFDAAEQALQHERFDYVIHCLFDWNVKAQHQRLIQINKKFGTPVSVWQEDK
jgi:hypothetical protein